MSTNVLGKMQWRASDDAISDDEDELPTKMAKSYDDNLTKRAQMLLSEAEAFIQNHETALEKKDVEMLGALSETKPELTANIRFVVEGISQIKENNPHYQSRACGYVHELNDIVARVSNCASLAEIRGDMVVAEDSASDSASADLDVDTLSALMEAGLTMNIISENDFKDFSIF